MSDQNQHDRVHILVVDDEKAIREVMQEGVEKAGYECYSASDGFEGLMILAEKPIDVVISDIKMPGMNGIEFARRIKEKHDADIILVTGYVETYSYDQAVDIGVSDFLQKPIGINELVLRVRRVLRERTNIRERKRAEAELRESLEKLKIVMECVVETMALAIESRDPYTSGHQKRVALLAGAIASELGLPHDQIQGIRLAGMIHDIGKIAVPAEILSKPGRLTELELRMIQEHSRIGHDILE
jgi:putative two-component system response regulator